MWWWGVGLKEGGMDIFEALLCFTSGLTAFFCAVACIVQALLRTVVFS
jgi:hypothetical protein